MIHSPPAIKLSVNAIDLGATQGFQIGFQAAHSVKIWSDSCEWGYDSLVLVVRDRYNKIHRLDRRPVSWRKNFPKILALTPGALTHYTTISSLENEWPGITKFVGRKSCAFEYSIADNIESRDLEVWHGQVRSNWISIR